MEDATKVTEYRERKEQLSGWPIRIVSYRLGSTYYVSIHNEEPGAWIVRKEGTTLTEVEAAAREAAAQALVHTVKRHSSSSGIGSTSG